MRYDNAILRTTDSGKRYYKAKMYPSIPFSEDDVYVITTIGDRLDLLAYSYYNRVDLWWIISIANNNVTKGSLFPIPGTQLRIPLNVSEIIQSFNDENNL